MNFAALGRGRESLLNFLTLQIAFPVAFNASCLIKEVSSLEGPFDKTEGREVKHSSFVFLQDYHQQRERAKDMMRVC
jgi:hypothetical protein